MEDDNPVASALRGRGRVAVVHHWDADGISSAAMVMEEAGRVVPRAQLMNTSPVVGRWALGPEERASLARWGPDLLVLVDLALRDDDLGDVLGALPRVPVVMVDHHRSEPPRGSRVDYHNPVAEGGPEEESPSCSWVLKGLLGRPVDLLSAIGVFGDRGRGLEGEPIWPQMRTFLDGSGLEVEDMHRLVDLLDSSAKRRDLTAVNAAVGTLMDGWREPRGLLEVPEWVEGAQEVDRVLGEELERGPETVVHRTLVKTIDTPYLVISTAARRLLRSRDQEVVVVVNTGYSEREFQMYVRRRGGLDLAPLIETVRGRGHSAGGKGEVLGAIAPKEALDGVLEDVMAFLRAHGYADVNAGRSD